MLIAILCPLSIAQIAIEPPQLLPSEPTPTADPPAETALDQQPEIRLPLAHHAWCHFEPGAWRAKRTVTESFDAEGHSSGVSVTSETETLRSVNKTHYFIESQSTVEVGEQVLSGPDRQLKFHLLTDTADEKVEAVEQSPAQINLDGRTIPCIVWRLTVKRGDRRVVHEVYYNDSIWPYVLRRESKETSVTDQTPLSTSRESVIRTDVPIQLKGKIVSAAHVLSTTESPAGRTERFEVHSAGVPGGLVSRSTTEWDSAVHRIRWSTTELEDFGPQERNRRPLRRLLRRGRDR